MKDEMGEIIPAVILKAYDIPCLGLIYMRRHPTNPPPPPRLDAYDVGVNYGNGRE